MIKTIIFTKAFKQNLSKFNKVEVVESPLVNTEVLKDNQIEEITEQKIEPPKFKELEYQVDQVNIVKKDYGSLSYEPVLRKFRVRPDLTEEIRNVKQGVNDEIEKVNNMLKEEESRFNKVKEQQDKLMKFVKETDLRNKDNIR